ncbi:MAG: hypothetical protein ACHQAX_08990, partial [Gammaproteobacteria bacterium]
MQRANLYHLNQHCSSKRNEASGGACDGVIGNQTRTLNSVQRRTITNRSEIQIDTLRKQRKIPRHKNRLASSTIPVSAPFTKWAKSSSFCDLVVV